jgi:hypothetical protein
MQRDKIYEKKKETCASAANATVLTRLSKRWATKEGANQDGGCKILLAEAFKNGYENRDIALEIRRYSFRRMYFDETKCSADKLYQNISRRIRDYRQSYKKGKERRKAMKKKTLNPAAKIGRQPTVHQNDLAQKVMETVEQWIEQDKRVTRTMIFRRALEIDPNFMGGINDPQCLTKMKKWFYYGFIKKHDLSVRKISSVGQKLPRNWEDQMVNMRDRVRHRQGPKKQPDGKVLITGVSDAYYWNTDHVPVWGKKDSGRRTVKTGGKEKDRFTVQLGVGKGGAKLRPLIIFKGEKNCVDNVVSLLPPYSKPSRQSQVKSLAIKTVFLMRSLTTCLTRKEIFIHPVTSAILPLPKKGTRTSS